MDWAGDATPAISIERLESGKTCLGGDPNGGERIDITQEEIARLRRNIADLQAMLDKTHEQNLG